MAKARSLVSLDVHATKIVAAVLDAETGQLQTCQMTGETEKTAEFCAALPRPVRPRMRPGRRGSRDAEHLVRLLWAGKLHPVRVPGAEEMTATPGLTGTASGLRRSGTRPSELAGRNGEIDDFKILLARLHAGRPEQSQIITGLCGVGKTVLLNTFEDLAEGAGYLTVFRELTQETPLPELLAKDTQAVFPGRLGVLGGGGRRVSRSVRNRRSSTDRQIRGAPGWCGAR